MRKVPVFSAVLLAFFSLNAAASRSECVPAEGKE